MKIKVLIVDDHLLLLESLRKALENDPTIQVVGTISSPKFLMNDIINTSPDVVLMDIRIKSYNGLDLMKDILKKMPQLPIIILSGYNYEEYIQAAYNAGASAFVTKETSNEELLFTIKQVQQGYKLFPSTAKKQDNESLTSKEREILKLIAEDKTNIEISDELMISKRTVEHHISSIIRKLDVDSRVGAIVTAIKQGIITLN
ncbi:response regulator transcription factor [Lysinibacillus pakistanensis]|uniref:response regulator n=1 Tax=Lysinibacillus pakistanensis TaxID=759811 RepID=UPI003D2C20CE